MMLDESKLFSLHGLRALSLVHEDRPCVFDVTRAPYRADFEPAESLSGLFGGSSNRRGLVEVVAR